MKNRHFRGQGNFARHFSSDAAPQTSPVMEGSEDLQDNVLCKVLEKHKNTMKKKYYNLFEDIKMKVSKTQLNKVYTPLYMIETKINWAKREHELLQMEINPREPLLQDIPIVCNDIFKSALKPGADGQAKEEKPKTVLTKGVAGIGKTVSVQKFILDWAEGRANQDVDFMFVLPFRELNLIKDEPCSLHKLLCTFHPELKDLEVKIYDQCNVLFIFDGLDESRIPQNFTWHEKVSDITETSLVRVLLTNLIEGELLPSARIWITSRPEAANQVPTEFINRFTEIHGFSDAQKEEYFMKAISDQDQAKKIVSHLKTARRFYNLCQIPAFCCISASVLQNIMKDDHTDVPETLTEMYTHYLLAGIIDGNFKNSDGNPKKLEISTREMIQKLAKLAFKQLMKGNVMLYEEDLKECGIVSEISLFSEIFTQIFNEESVLFQKKVYSFVHLSIQEFLAAVYVFQCCVSNNPKALNIFLRDDYDSGDSECSDESDCEENENLEDTENPDNDNSEGENSDDKEIAEEMKGSDEDESSEDREKETKHKSQSMARPVVMLLKEAVNRVLKYTGHLDLFLRFLLGISLESNQRLLQHLLAHNIENTKEISEFIKTQIVQGIDKDCIACIGQEDYDLSFLRTISLFLCLTEMNDQSFRREIQEFLKSGKASEGTLSTTYCTVMAYVILTSEDVTEELDWKKIVTWKEGYRRLLPAVKNCIKVSLAGCRLNTTSCLVLTSALQSTNCLLRELDLSKNKLHDTGVKFLSNGLKSSNCKLQILRLVWCNLTSDSCEMLATVLQTENCSLRDLDLSNNDLQDSGLKLLSDGLASPHCKLDTLRLCTCNLGEKACEYLGSSLQLSNSSLRELDLSNNDLQDSGVKLLSDGLRSSHCHLKILRLSGCMITEEGCSSLASALSSNPSHLKELDLTYNHPGESGINMLSARQSDAHYSLHTLKLEHGGIIRIKPGPKKYACNLTLDPNTTHNFLSISEENRKVTTVSKSQSYLDHPDRFDECLQVMCIEAMSGRSYWEAEWSGCATVVVTHRGIRRKGDSRYCGFDRNAKSWGLSCSNNIYTACHDNAFTYVHDHPPNSNRVGVFIDEQANTVSFYRVSTDTNTLTLLYTYHSSLTEPLYAGFGFGGFLANSCPSGFSACLCQIE